MTVRHNNPSQQVKKNDFNPLVVGESLYYSNLNRAPKNAYDYADNINNMLSYGGYVSRVLPYTPSQAFSLYDIVQLLDGEIIQPIQIGSNAYNRFGIVVSEIDSDGYYLICTFCPNLVLPSSVVSFSGTNGTSLYYNTTVDSSFIKLSTSEDTVNGATSSNIGGKPLAIITGTFSIFFSGTARLFTAQEFN